MIRADGWWLASDGNWYPPEAHPSRLAALPPPIAQPVAQPSAAWVPPAYASHQPWGPTAPAQTALPAYPAHATGTFRSRAVDTAGAVDTAIGFVLLAAGAAIAVQPGSRALPLGLILALVGAFFAVTGVGHLTARLEVGADTIAWTWNYSRTEHPLTDFVDAALVEKGRPASGAALAGMVGGGPHAVVAWWLGELYWSFATSGPTRGAYVLVLINPHGVRVPVPPIGTWTDPPSASAQAALDAARAAVTSPANLARQHRGPVGQARLGGWHRPG